MVALGVDSRLNFSPVSVNEECLLGAEESAEQILKCVRPTLDSEERRRDVIDYIQQLIKSRLHCEVVTYGSVPLKTYLPEGDIDLTVLKGPNAEETLINHVLVVIQEEERNENSEYKVNETRFIDAEKVKLVRCLCRNITIDISCNQLGGVSTLCFLEKVDQFIGRNHLFKRSIILVKSWCYYESRILGAHHGLMSTYALEILVLYIFNFFHSSLIGPLSALHRFLEYFSQFDWENYCISLKGPVCRSSLSEISVSMHRKPPDSPFLSEEFLESCMEMFSTYCKEQGNSKALQIKHLNVIDPLKENNNLGRSVNRGNYFRIISAMKYGFHSLNQILSQSKEKVADEILGYFANTCRRNEHGHRSILQSPALDIDHEISSAPVATSLAVFQEPASVTDDLRSFTTEECPIEMASDSSSCTICTPDPSEDQFYITTLSDNSYGRELDTINTDESEVLYALADLTGDYDNHIRSLLRGLSCQWFSSITNFSSNPLSSSSRGTQISAMKESTMATKNSSVHVFVGAAGDSTFFSRVFGFPWNQKAQGIGTYFPNMNVIHSERTSLVMGHLHLYNCNNGLYHPSQKPKVHPLKTTYHGRSRKSNVTDTNRFRIKFGILGDNQKRSPPLKTRAIHHFNEMEFPPLPINCTSKPSLPPRKSNN